MSEKDFNWTDEKVQGLLKGRARRDSYAKIASSLGTTKGSCIRKAVSLGLISAKYSLMQEKSQAANYVAPITLPKLQFMEKEMIL